MPINYTPEYWDHLRDERKHEPRPSDIPLRLQPKPLSTAHDVALIVRAISNIDHAAELIERYADAKAAAQRLDAVAAGARP